MTKSSKITIIGFLLSICILIYGYFSLTSTSDSITIQEEVLYGDSKDVAGYSLSSTTHMNYHHFWDITIPLGNSNAALVDHTYYKERQRAPQGKEFLQFNLMDNIYRSQNTSLEVMKENFELEQQSEESKLTSIIIDVASRAPLGQAYSETVYWNDYYDDIAYSIYDDFAGEDNNQYFSEEARQKLQDYFSFPSTDNNKLTVNVTIYDDSVEAEVKGFDDIFLSTNSIVAKDVIYLAVEYANGQLPKQNDLYAIHYHSIGDGWGLDINDIQHLLSFESNIQFIDMKATGDNIMIALNKEDTSYLRIYKKDDFSHSLSYKLPFTLTRDIEDSITIMDNSICITNQLSQCVVYELVENEYSMILNQSIGTSFLKGEEFINRYSYYYNDGKFFVIGCMYEGDNGGGDYLVQCFDNNQLLYVGRYHSSQLEEVLIEDNYNLNIEGYNSPTIITN